MQLQARISPSTINRAATEVFYGGERYHKVSAPTLLPLAAALALGIGLALRPLQVAVPSLPTTLSPALTVVAPPVAIKPLAVNQSADPVLSPVQDKITRAVDVAGATAMPVSMAAFEPKVVEAVLPEVEQVGDLNEQLSSLTTVAMPVAELLQLWGEFTESDQATRRDTGCEQLAGYSLQCLVGVGGWADLRAFNRPAVLTVTAPDGREQTLLLRALADDRAVLQFAAGPIVVVALSQLAAVWTGEYWLFWRPPVATKLIGPGSHGESVVWLRRQLALIDGKLPSPEQRVDRYDADLEARVRLFQRSRRLDVDGLVGARTMLLLNNIDPLPGTPVLATSLSGKV